MKLKIDSFPTCDLPLSVIELSHNITTTAAAVDEDNITNNTITFFGSIPSMLENIDSILVELDKFDNNKVFDAFIDVSETLSEPKIIQNREDIVRRKYTLLHIKQYLDANIGANCLDTDCWRHYWNNVAKNSDDDSGTIDLCFVTGVILGYPIIYCNNTPDTGNCLSYQTLTHYTVNTNSTSQEIFSFSVPHLFQQQYENRINHWFNLLSHRSSTFYDLKLTHCLETHPLILN